MSSVSNTRAQWRQSAFRIRGRLLAGDERGTLIHCGELPQYKTWVANLFAESDPPERIGSFSLADIARQRGVLADADAILCPINPLSRMLFPIQSWFIVPKYVECLIDLGLPLEQLVRRHGAKDDLRIIRKKNYRFEIRHDDASFDEFYHDMLVPTASKRHEDRAHISSLEHLRNIFRSGYLLAAYLDDEWVGANLIVPRPGGVVNWANVGWRGGNEQLMKDRVVPALLHEMIVRAQADGFQTLNLGSCAPFVNDGPLNFKLKWGAHLAPPQILYENNQLQGANAYIAAHYRLTATAGRSMLKHAPILDHHGDLLRAIGWQSTLRPDFRHQVEQGLAWIDVAEQLTAN